MSSSIDERIVGMKFDNTQFERGVSQSVASLDKLKKGLDLQGASRGLDNLSDSASRVNISGIATGVENISSKFSAMGVVGVTALMSITNAAITAGAALLKMATNSIFKGFDEYNLQLNSTQTILANTQEKVGKVNQTAINEINKSAVASTAAIKESNAESLESFRRSQSKQAKEYQKSSDSQLDTFRDRQDKERDSLTQSLDAERDALRKSHDAKLDMYDTEYMAKLKSIDESRYNQIKNINDEIKGIKNKTKFERDNLEVQEDQKKLNELMTNVSTSRTIQKRQDAEKALNAYKESLTRKATGKERENRLTFLEEQKSNINTETDQKKTALKTEYDEKKKQENDMFKVSTETLKTQQDLKLSNLKTIYDMEKQLFKDKQDAEKEAFAEKQYQELKAMESNHKQALSYIDSEKNSRIKDLQKKAASTRVAGSTKLEVTAALDELNQYSDKTIYNFAQMTSNIAKFTAAGVELKPAVKAIKGISNLAALAGANNEDAARAMYQLSQAMSSGTVKLQDWNSVVNANIGNETFKNAIMETARVRGVAIDDIIAKEGDFRESLQTGWLTSDILLESLSKFTGDLTDEQLKSMGYTEQQTKDIQKLAATAVDSATKIKTFPQLMDTLGEAATSGWATAWRMIIGDLDQAKELWTNVNDVVGGFVKRSAEARNNMLKLWGESGGRQAIVNGLVNIFKAFSAVIKPIAEAMSEIFPPSRGEALIKASHGFEYLTKKLIISGDTADKLKMVFKGFFSAIKFGVDMLSGAINVFDKIYQVSSKVGSGIRVIMEDIISSTLNLVASMGGVEKMLDPLKNIITTMQGFMGDAFIQIGKYNIEGLIVGMWMGVKEAIQFIVDLGKNIIQAAKDAFGQKSPSKFFEIIGMFNIQGLIQGMMSMAGALKDTIVYLAKATIDAAKIAFSKLGEVFGSIGEGIKSAAIWVADGVMSIVKSLKKLGSSDTDSAVKSTEKKISPIVFIINTMKTFVDYLEKLGTSIGLNFGSIGNTIAKWAGAIGDAISGMLTKENLETFGSFFRLLLQGGFFLLFRDLVKTFKNLAGGINDTLESTRGALKAWQDQLKSKILLNIAIAVGILAASLFVLAKIPKDKLMGATGAIGALVAQMVVSLALFGKMSAGVMDAGKAMAVMIGLSTSVLILAKSLEVLSRLKPEQLANGVVAITALMALLVTSIVILGKAGASMSKGMATVILFTGALYSLSYTVEKLGSMDVDKLKLGLGALATMLIAVGAFLVLSGTAKNIMSVSSGLVIFAGAMYILTFAVAKMGEMDPTVFQQGLSGLGILLVGVMAFLIATGGGKDVLTAGLGIIAFAAALILLGVAVERIAAINWNVFKQGIKYMSFLLVGIIAFIVATGYGKDAISTAIGVGLLAVAMVALASAVVIIAGIDWNVFKQGALYMGILLVGVVAFIVATGAGKNIIPTATGLIIFAGALLLMATALTMLGALSWGAMLFALGTLIALLVVMGGAAYILAPLSPVIITLAGAMAIFSGAIVLLGIGIALLVPALLLIAPALVALSLAFIAGAPIVFKAIEVFLKGCLKLISTLIDDIVVVVMEIIEAFLKALLKYIPRFADYVLKIIIAIAEAVRNNIGRIAEVAIEIVVAFVRGIINKLSLVIDTAFLLVLKLIEGIADAVDKYKTPIIEATRKLLKAFVSAVGDLGYMLLEVGTEIVKGVANGIANSAGKLKESVKGMAGDVMNTVKDAFDQKSPSKAFEQVGKYNVEGLIIGMEKMAAKLGISSEDLANASIDPMGLAVEKIKALMNSNTNFTPTIKPVLDLTEVEKGLSSTFGKTQGINVSGIVDKIGSVAANRQNGSINTISSPITPSGNIDMSKIEIVNNYQVRGENDIKKISQDQRTLIDKYARSKGVTIP